MIQWDPLSEQINDADIVAEAKKRQIKNILKSYVGIYDPFSELIQNGMDAVDLRAAANLSEDYQRHLYIQINLQDEIFSITDNGIGFNESQFKGFLAPNISFKEGSKTRGHKGVGSTYIGFGFNYLQLGTKTPEFTLVAELSGGRSWVEDNERILTRPEVRESTPIHEAFEKIDRGSTFTIKFGGNKTRPKSLNSFDATTAEQWLNILLIKTPLGHIDFFGENATRVNFDLTVIDKSGKLTEIRNYQSGYIYPHLKIKATTDLKEIASFQLSLVQNSQPLTNLQKRYKRLNGIFEFFKSSELLDLFPASGSEASGRRDLINEFKITAYGFFCYSTEVWDELNDKILKLRPKLRILRGGIQLANNYMPQGDLIVIPLTSNVGYQNQTHIVVHFSNADPDLGRKGFQPELKELAESIATRIVNRFKKWREILKTDTGQQPTLASADKVYDWLLAQVKYEEANPLIITNPNFFEPIKEISITSIPQSEQDVIVLFNQLIAGGVIRGIKLMATDGRRQYDGVFKFYIKEPIKNHEYDKTKNPLGVLEMENKTEYTSRPLILEYKLSVDALLREFENEEKFEQDINLVIAWSMGEEWHKRYSVTSLLDESNLNLREFHGLTHIMYSGINNKTYAIILSELIDYLNNTDGVQNLQVKKYSQSLDA